MYDAFLSHSSLDHDRVGSFFTDLTNLGLQSWYDEACLQPGDSLIQKLEAGVWASRHLVVFLSKNSVDSPWVKKEVNVALTQEINGRRMNVIAVRLDECEVPLFLQDKVWVDMSNPSRERFEFARLFKALLSARPTVPRLRLVSKNAHATGTNQHRANAKDNRFDPSNVLEHTDEDEPKCGYTYWLLQDNSPGDVVLDLGQVYPLRLVRILNTHNWKNHDRVSKFIEVHFEGTGNTTTLAWSGPIPRNPDWLSLWFNDSPAATVRIVVTEWLMRGGGLNCVEVYAAE